MKVALIIAMAFIVPLAAIFIFIALDTALTRFCNWVKNKSRGGKRNNIVPTAPVVKQALPPVIAPAGKHSAPTNAPAKSASCGRCAGCKLAAKGGCPRQKKSGVESSSS